MPPPPSPLVSSHHRKPSKKHWFLTPWKSKSLLFSMPSILLLSILSLSLFFSISSARNRLLQPPSSALTACKSTRFPDLCQSSISQSSPPLPADPTALQIINSALAISTQNLKTAQTKVKSILDSSAQNQNRSNAAKTCLDILSYSDRRIQAAVDALSRDKIKDARAWVSAAHVYHYDCWSELKYVNGTKQVGETMAFLDTLVQYSSNALSMMMAYDYNGKETASWVPPKTERNGFYGPVSGGGGGELGFNGGIPSNLKTDVTVCKDGSGGCYSTVQEAVNAAPDNKPGRPFVIRIKEGVYEEIVRVPFEKKNVVFLGDGIGKTVITGSLSVGNTAGMTTYRSATVAVLGDGFMASGITFQNTAGPDGHQAVAFRSESDLSIIENCKFIGNQDTLYAHTLRQFYKKCRIQGNVDFIFGHSAAIFQDCEILVAPRQVKPEKGENNAVTAHGRIDPAQATGFVFHNCLINGTDEYMKFYYSKPEKHKNFLGRPWKEYSRTVFIQSTLEALVHPNGWMPFRGDFALKTLFYGEYQNSGSGSDVSKRVSWSSRIPAAYVSLYSVQNFIQGNEWIPTSS